MIKTKRNLLSPSFRNAAAILALCAVTSLPAQAQDSELVISPSSAETIKTDVNYEGADLNIDGEGLQSLGVLDLHSDFVEPLSVNIEENVPAIEIEGQNNSKLTLGVLRNGTDTGDGLTRRDPYAIENIEVDPIYPEGIYVDEMRATAGIGVTSEF